MTHHSEILSLLGMIEAGASGLTLCRVSRGTTLVGPPFAGVSALQVLSGTMYFEGPETTQHVVRAGELALVPANIRPRIAAGSQSSSREIDGRTCLRKGDGWMIADAATTTQPDLVVAAARITGSKEGTLSTLFHSPVATRAAGRRAIAMLREEVVEPGPGSGAFAAALLEICIVLGLRIAIERMATDPGRNSIAPMQCVARAVDAMKASPAEPHSVASLAALAGMSRSTFVRHFARVMQTSPMAYLAEVRVREAATMLRTTALPVKSVAAAAGFADRSHFARRFRARFGMDPSAYRAADTVERDSWV